MSKKITQFLHTEKKPNFGKSDSRYWNQDGKLIKENSSHWTMPIMFKKRRERFQLGTGNKVMASKKAAEIYASLVKVGMDATLALYKPKGEEKIESPTVGQFAAVVEALGQEWSIRPRTKADYLRALRLIVSEIEGVGGKANRHDYSGDGRDLWLEKIHAVKLVDITTDKVNKWKAKRLKGKDHLEIRSARTTINTVLRKAKSLFASQVIERVEGKVILPSPLPFAGVKLEKAQKSRYISKFHAGKLLDAAFDELDDEPLKIVLLCLLCGLRQREADYLPWDHVDTERGTVLIETTKWLEIKSETSRRLTGIPPTALPYFAKWKEDEAKGEFVIKSELAPHVQGKSPRDRSRTAFKTLKIWLKSKGLTAQKPTHELRKEYGSQMVKTFTLLKANIALGHSNYNVTVEHYADVRGEPSIALCDLVA